MLTLVPRETLRSLDPETKTPAHALYGIIWTGLAPVLADLFRLLHK